MVRHLKSCLGPPWFIGFISLLFFFFYPEVGVGVVKCVWGEAGLQSPQQMAGMGTLRLGSPNPLDTLLGLSLLLLGLP